MTYIPHVYAYLGATCEDVYAEQDDSDYYKLSSDQLMDLMATPQIGFITLKYSEEKIRELAAEMWEVISEVYQEPDHEEVFPLTLDHLRVSTSAKVCEPIEGHVGPLPVIEVTVLDYYHPVYITTEPLMRIVVQKRPVH